MHGPTFMANPLATAAALASTGISRGRCVARRMLRGSSADCSAGLGRALPGVADVRVQGRDRRDRARRTRRRGRRAPRSPVEHGVWLRPFRNLIYTMPPYVTDDEDLRRASREAMVACAIVA